LKPLDVRAANPAAASHERTLTAIKEDDPMPAARSEADVQVIEPDLPIVDAHHHLLVHTGHRYLIEEYQADVGSGHNVVASVYIECNSMVRQSGPEALRPVGEIEFAAGVAAMSESGLYGPTHICAAIVGAADLMLGDAVDPVLEAMTVAGGGRFRGVRGAANWDADASINTGTRPFAPQGLLLDARFRAGIARLAARGLVFDAFQYHTQMPEFCSLADAFPGATMVLDHCGGLVGIGPYAGPQNHALWKRHITEVARRPNVQVKLGGLASPRSGFGFGQRAVPPTAEELATAWRPYIQTCIELFGPERCMFESNFPPDRAAGSYRTIWNAFKLLASGATAAEKAALFGQTARRVYAIG
jgi:predicted TIM-barrel fold metal-dependent hydrolase